MKENVEKEKQVKDKTKNKSPQRSEMLQDVNHMSTLGLFRLKFRCNAAASIDKCDLFVDTVYTRVNNKVYSICATVNQRVDLLNTKAAGVVESFDQKRDPILDRMCAFTDKVLVKIKWLMTPFVVAGRFIAEVSTIRWVKVSVAVCALLVTFTLDAFLMMPRTVTVVVDDSIVHTEETYHTLGVDVGSIIKLHDVDYTYGDKVTPDMSTKVTDGMTIEVDKAFKVRVVADGKSEKYRSIEMPVSRFIKIHDIKLKADDLTSPGLDQNIHRGEDLIITRVTYGTDTVEATIPYKSTKEHTSSLPIGKVDVIQDGKNGTENLTYKVTYHDGKEYSRHVIKKDTVIPQQTKITGVGTNINMSAPSGLNYSKKLTGVRAVSYNFSGNPHGSYGRACTYGTCAVDPKVIPLGTRLYITGYGYAIANDTGTSIKGKTVDVYFSERECCYIWGARSVTVYILN